MEYSDSVVEQFMSRFGDPRRKEHKPVNEITPSGVVEIKPKQKSLEDRLMKTTDEPGVKNGKSGALMSMVSSFSQMGNAMPSGGFSDYGGDEELQKANQGMNAAKDAVGSAVPMAGMFRGIEKGVVNIAGSTHGEEGATVSQAMFSPSSNIMNIAKNDEMTSGEKTMGYVQTVINPIGAGMMLHSANMRAKKKKDIKDNLAAMDLEKSKREELYEMENNLESLKNLKALREKQFGIIS